MTYEELLIVKEKANYDFKESIPENKKISHEVCAFANHSNGGLLIIGLTDDGIPVGINNSGLDETELKLTNVIRDTCSPIPHL